MVDLLHLSGRWLSNRLLALVIKRFEVNLGQMKRRETSARDHVGDIRAQIGIQNVRTSDAEQ